MNERGNNMNIIRVLKKSIREYKRDSILTPVLVAFEALVECIIPLMVANLVNRMQNGCDLSVIMKYGVILIIMACFSLLFGALAGIKAANASAGFGKNLRKDLFVAVQNFSFENIDRFSASSLVTRMTTDVTNVDGLYDDYSYSCTCSTYVDLLIGHGIYYGWSTCVDLLIYYSSTWYWFRTCY